MTGVTEKTKRFRSEIPTTLLLLCLLAPSTGLVLGYVAGFNSSPENTRLFLSALAGAQASVLAIVFSVTVIGMQLIGTRYSPRMISMFTESGIFVFTFALFVISIAIDLILLFTVPQVSSRMYSGFLVAAAGTAVAVALTLFVFVKTSIDRSTPDGAIDAFQSRMTPSTYRRDVEQSVNAGSGATHPMRPLYNMGMNALSQGEYMTAEKAVSEYGNSARSMLVEFEKQEVFSETDRQVAKELFDPVLTEHLPEIALHAEEHDETQIVGDAIEWQYKLGKESLEISNERVARQAQFGLRNVIREAPVETESLHANNTAWDNIGDLLEDASEKQEPEIVYDTAGTIASSVSRQLPKVSDIHWYRYAMRDLFQSLETAHENLINHYEEELATVDMEWQYEMPPDEIEDREQVYAVYRWRKALYETTDSLIQYSVQEEYSPLNFVNVDMWRDICISASTSDAEDYAITLCQAMIEMAVAEKYGEESSGLPVSYRIARIKHEGDPEIVRKAFDRILSYEYVESRPGITEMGVEQYETYYPNQLSIEGFGPLNTVSGFDETVEQIHQAVDERVETLEG